MLDALQVPGYYFLRKGNEGTKQNPFIFSSVTKSDCFSQLMGSRKY